MSAFLVAGPTIEPVSIADIRDWLKIDTSEEDTLLTTLVATARAALERHVRRAFVSQTWRFIYASTATDGAMRLPLAPLLSVVELRVYDGAGAITSAPPQALELDLDIDRPAVRLLDADLVGAVGWRLERDAAAQRADLKRAHVSLTRRYGETSAATLSGSNAPSSGPESPRRPCQAATSMRIA